MIQKMTEREMRFLTFYRELDPKDQELIRSLLELANTLSRLHSDSRLSEGLSLWSETTN